MSSRSAYLRRRGRVEGETIQQTAGPDVVKLIEKMLDDERASKASAQARGIAVITTSGTLVTLLLAFGALATRKSATFTLPSTLKLPLTLASLLLVLAACVGLTINAPDTKATQLDLPNLHEALARLWNSPPEDVTCGIAMDQLDVLIDARRLNARRAWLLAIAIAIEILGIACATWAVVALVTAA